MGNSFLKLFLVFGTSRYFRNRVLSCQTRINVWFSFIVFRAGFRGIYESQKQQTTSETLFPHVFSKRYVFPTCYDKYFLVRTKLLNFGEIRCSWKRWFWRDSATFQLSSDLDRGPGHKNRPQKRVRTAFLTFPMSSQLFFFAIFLDQNQVNLKNVTLFSNIEAFRLVFEWTDL